MTRDIRFFVVICAALSVRMLGCGQTFTGGLANSPSARRSSQPRGQHDVISNGPNSCGGDEPGEQYRLPRCANATDTEPDADTVAASKSGDTKEKP